MRTRNNILFIILAVIAALFSPANQAWAAKPSWDEVKKSYQYDHAKPLNIQIADTKDFTGFQKIHFYYDSLSGGRVPAILMLPKPHVKPMGASRATVQGTFPVMFFMHFHVSDKSLSEIFATWPGQGIAVMAIDGVYKGEREEKGKDIFAPDPKITAERMKMQILDILRGFDVLAQWKGIDPGRIGYMGISMGAITGTAAVTLDDRVKSSIIADGAADFSIVFEFSDYGEVKEIRQFMKENNVTKDMLQEGFNYVDPMTFAPHLGDRPIFLMNGETDSTMTLPAMKKLHELVTSKDKKIKWYKSGHILPFDKVVYDAVTWFKKTL